ncbi:hypothetical protein HDV06_001484 [Boothiomyces sp. JEL0866]|nr:hypothetical protein HDV06_001484 [Boothiomyces sp. JEL0866]
MSRKFSKLNKAIENLGNGVVFASDIIYDDKNIKEYLVYGNYDFIKNSMTEPRTFNLYEIFLENNKCNFIQDLDIKDADGLKDPEQRLDNVINETTKCFKEYMALQNVKDIIIDTFVLVSPQTETKASYHVIYRIKDKNNNNYYFQNLHIGCKNFYQFITINKKINLLGVDAIYAKNRCFRILNSSKIEFQQNKLRIHPNYPVENVLETLGTFIEPKETDKLIQTVQIHKTKKVVSDVVELKEIENGDLVDNLLDCLKDEWAVDYHSWNKLGILLYCIYKGNDIGLEKWDKFSRKCPEKYNRGTIENYWINYGNLEIMMTIGSLHYYAKLDNLQKYQTDEIQQSKSQKSDSLSDEENEQIDIQNALKDKLTMNLKMCQYQNNIISQLEFLMYVRDNDFDNNPKIFAFDNGVFDFEIKEFRKGKYEEFITLTTGYNYKYEDSKLAMDFVSDIFTDDAIREYFLMIIASYLVFEHKREEFFVLYNKRGNNGKSTFVKALEMMQGYYFYTCKSNVLTEQTFDSADGATPTINKMDNKRLISFQEIKGTAILDSNTIKMLSGGDKINARGLYKDCNEFYINGMLLLSCNEIPKFNKIDGAIIRRMRCIELETEFVEKIEKPHQRLVKDIDTKVLKHSLFQLLIEKYNPNILKGIKYCPEKIRKTTESYFNRTDNIQQFITDYIIKDELNFCIKKDIENLIRDKDISRDYKFGKLPVKDIINDILDKLDLTFIKEKRINGKKYYNVLLGYSIKLDEEETVDSNDGY